MPEGFLTDIGNGFADALPPTAGVSAFADVVGAWQVRRIVVDHLSGAVHRFAGTAVISTSAFVETGEVAYGSVLLKANRSYGLKARADGVDIAFSDGRPFISLDGRASQNVRHLCGDDDYRGRFVFAAAGGWVEAWRVSGPRKRYASLARYRRLQTDA